MPGLVRLLAYDFFARRDGLSGWQRHRDEFRALAAATPAGVREHALERLRSMLCHAFETVPHYRDAWRAIGFAPSAETTVEDLRDLPVLTKDHMRDRKTELVSRAVPFAALHLDLTGGTTGTQTAFYRDHACRVARFGRQWGILGYCGYDPGDTRALVWGSHADVAASTAARGIKARVRHFSSADETICCTVMSRDDMRAYHRRLSAFRPQVLYGYPNAIEQFARFLQDEGLPPIAVRRIFCTAEALQDRQRALFQRVFGGEVFNLYCSREHGCAAFECSRHRGLHVDAGSVVVDILANGRPARPGESGDIVVTDLLNFGMPLIRYVTGDRATACDAPCDCGCPLPLIASLDGRTADTLFRPDGSTVAGLMLDDLFVDLPVIRHAQFVQHDVTSLDVNVVLTAGVTADLTAAMIRQVRSIMGPDIRVRIHVVDDIPRNPRSGKYQLVINKIPSSTPAKAVTLC
jgi:phenylacetate-CoA ligase